MHTIRNTYGKLTRILTFVLAIHILNLSVDPRDLESDYIPEDLAVNDIESIVEFFAETVFGFTDAFAEHDEADDHGAVVMDFYKVFCSNQEPWHLMEGVFTTICVRYFIYNSDILPLLARDINSPPPRA